MSTPIWGKFADLFNRKLLIQLALVIFVIGSALAGFSQDTGTLIGFRVLQGLGAGGLAALSQIIMADIISPRDRGRYAGLFGAVMAVGTVGGPLLGGVVTDAFGWRWNFFIALPIAIVAIVLLQRTLHLPAAVKRAVKIDYLGAALIAGGVSLLLIWVTLAGNDFEWASVTSFVMVAGAAAAAHRRRDRRVQGRTSRSSRSPCSRTAPSPWPSSPASRSACRCSAPRSSSASTCSWPAAPRPPSPACSPSR